MLPDLPPRDAGTHSEPTPLEKWHQQTYGTWGGHRPSMCENPQYLQSAMTQSPIGRAVPVQRRWRPALTLKLSASLVMQTRVPSPGDGSVVGSSRSAGAQLSLAPPTLTLFGYNRPLALPMLSPHAPCLLLLLLFLGNIYIQ